MQPFHDFDPYDHLMAITEQLSQTIDQHNRLAHHVNHMTREIDRLKQRLQVAENRIKILSKNTSL